MITSIRPHSNRQRLLPLFPRDYVSFSAINAYRRCPLSYYFRYVACLDEPTVSANLVFGAAIHRAIEYHYRQLLAGGEVPSLARLMDEYQLPLRTAQGRQVLYGKAESRDTLTGLARRLLAKFLASEWARPAGTILAVEERLRGPVFSDMPDLLGVVDLVEITPEELVIVDWKTAAQRWSPQQVADHAEQLLLYTTLVREVAQGKPIRLEFRVFTKTKAVSIERYSLLAEPAQIERTQQMVKRVWQAIEGAHFYSVPSAMNCSGCPFRKPCQQWPGEPVH